VLSNAIRGPLLIPMETGSVVYHADGVLAGDDRGKILFAGNWLESGIDGTRVPVRQSEGVMLPPLLDIHTHISQHPIRGRFLEGVEKDGKEGKLLAGLYRNVYPAEAKCSQPDIAERTVRQFLADTLSHGVVGGAAYMTTSATATDIALSILPDSWSVGLVLMDQNCPENLRTDEPQLDEDIQRLANRYGRRFIVTDRFAVVVSSRLRRQASALAGKFGLRAQTHLNEQVAEKSLIETELYPGCASYTDVYLQDGLLDHQCIAAHCVQMTEEEWRILRATGTVIAHCPTSNALLGSGVMALDEVMRWKIPYAIATDVAASPTVSMLAEMRRFLQVHAGRSDHATPAEALYRSTRAPAELLRLEHQIGRLQAGSAMSFIEVEPGALSGGNVTESIIRSLLPEDPDHPGATVRRVTLGGRCAFQTDRIS
jgi:guanine deaminase